MAFPVQCHAGFAVEIEIHIIVDERAYVPEPPLDTEHKGICYHFAFIPYVLVGKVHAFMGPLPKYIKKPQLLHDYFSIYCGYEPLVFIDEPLKFNFFKNWVFHSSLPSKDVEYIKWMDRFKWKNNTIGKI